jgi:transposase-like protein
MPWRCPACSTPIQHNEFEPEPRPHERYRCHVCRLELMLDERTKRLEVMPLEDDRSDPEP